MSDDVVITKKLEDGKIIIVYPSKAYKMSIIDLLAKINEYDEVRERAIEEVKKMLIENWKMFFGDNVDKDLTLEVVLNKPIKVRCILRGDFGEERKIVTINANIVKIKVDSYDKAAYLILSRENEYNVYIPIAISEVSRLKNKDLFHVYIENGILNLDKLQTTSKRIIKELEGRVKMYKRVIGELK